MSGGRLRACASDRIMMLMLLQDRHWGYAIMLVQSACSCNMSSNNIRAGARCDFVLKHMLASDQYRNV